MNRSVALLAFVRPLIACLPMTCSGKIVDLRIFFLIARLLPAVLDRISWLGRLD
jgi:hypothetical protein